MVRYRSLLYVGVAFALATVGSHAQYTATWESLNTRPTPDWYDEAKFGIFITWGIFSVPSFGTEWFWDYWKSSNMKDYVEFMRKNYPPNFTYQEFGPQFTAEFFNPEEWAELFQSSGAKYVVLTSKHHEGYTLWPSKTSFSWNSMDVGPKRDIVGDLANAIKSKTELKFGVYHSLLEWFNPLYVEDREFNENTDGSHNISQRFVDQKTLPALYELVKNYKPEVIWSDGGWEANDDYWKSKDFLAWLFSESPVKDTVVTSDGWGQKDNRILGDFNTFTDRYHPDFRIKHKWAYATSIDTKSWGFRRNAKLSDYLSMDQLIQMLAQTVSCGGNLLINIGPTKEGIIMPIYEERLRGMGEWLKINGEAIYSTKPWTEQKDKLTPGVWYTKSGPYYKLNVYAIVLEWPKDEVLKLGAPKLANDAQITLLGYDQPLKWRRINEGIEVTFPEKAEVISEWAWVLKFTNVK